jgi:integrase
MKKLFLMEDIMRIKDYENLFAPEGEWRRKRAEKKIFFREKSLKTRTAVMKNYIIPLWGNYHPKRLTVKIIDKSMAGISSQKTNKPLAGATRNRILSVLNELYIHLIEDGKIKINPTHNVVRCRSYPETPRNALTLDEMDKIFPGCREEIETKTLMPNTHERLKAIWRTQKYVCAFLILKDTGLRPGELVALHWKDWHSDVQFFPIVKAMESGSRIREKGTKTGATKPAIISDRTAIEIELLKKIVRPASEDDYIFCNCKNIPYHPSRLTWNFHKAAERANLKQPNYSPYWLRHTFNTHMLETIQQATVQRLTGHSSESMVRHYRHADAESLKREAARIKDEVNAGRLC